MGRSVFITATDTGAGKSFITAALTRALLAAGRDVAAIKPVSCGRREDELNDDVALLLKAQGMDMADAGKINLYDFAEFSAPAFAAPSANEAVDVRRLADWCDNVVEQHALTLIEGIGGLFAPLSMDMLVSDWLQRMPQAEVLLVVHARLGGINHALLTLEALKQMRRSPSWIVVNGADADSEAMLAQHCRAIAPRLCDENTGDAGHLLSLTYSPPGVACVMPEALLVDFM
ncbi:MAG: dethiobiotin synthase [Mariprofundaceae bacterium]|nr:dethiobiotin synthase [Mariprofundaceae bacterium]